MSKNVIYKYTLGITDKQVLSLPRYPTFLKVAEQGGQLCLWALVDSEAELVPYTFRIYGTGHPIDVEEYDLDHIDSVLCQGGALVWHVFVDYTDKEHCTFLLDPDDEE